VVKVTVLPFVPDRPRPETHQQARHAAATTAQLPSLVTPIAIDPPVLSIDFIPPAPTQATDFEHGGISAGSGSHDAVAIPGATFRADQVERQVALLRGGPVPRYPESLRSAGIEGTVVAQFVVSELGRVESDSVRFLQSDNVLFEESVRAILRRMRFAPAEIGGKKVRQLVQMPFVFTISSR
jgi:periplasmic protein TonB